MPMGKRKAEVFIYNSRLDSQYKKLVEELESKINNFVKIIKTSDNYDNELISNFFINAYNNEEKMQKEKHLEHITLLLLILKSLPKLNRGQLEKIKLFVIRNLEENAISGIFIRESVSDFGAKYEDIIPDRYFACAEFLIDHLIKNYSKRDKIIALDLDSFTNNDDVKFKRNGLDKYHKINFISNTAVTILIDNLFL